MGNEILKVFLFSFLLLGAGNLFSQPDVEFSKYKNQYNKDYGVFILKRENVSIGFDSNKELSISSETYEERMLLDENARYFSEDKINSSGFISVSDVKPESWIPNGKKYSKIKVKELKEVDDFSPNTFYDDSKSINFIYPSLVPGAKTVLTYKTEYKEPRFYGQFFFGSYLPIEKSEYSISVEKGINIKYILFNVKEDQLKFTKTEDKKEITYTWQIKDLEKFRNENDAVSIRRYMPHIIVYVTDYEKDGNKQTVFSDVNDLYNWYLSLISETGSGSNPELLKHVVDSLKINATSEYDVVERVYYWVQDNIKYIAIEDGLGGFIPRDASTVYSRRYGDCKDMANIIHEMLKIANIPSHLTWIGTRDIPYSYNEVPTPIADNHMICTYISGDKYYFLDATSQFTPIALPSSFIQGKEALIGIGQGKYELVTIPEVKPDINLSIDSSKIKIIDGKVKGTGKLMLNGYTKIGIMHNLMNLDDTKKLKYLRYLLNKGNNKYFIENIEEHNLRDRNNGLLIDYNFVIEDYSRIHKDEIIINPHLTRPLQEAKIDLDLNQFDKERSYRNKELNVVEIEIPEGYKVQYLPKDNSFTDEAFGFKFKYFQVDNKVIVEQEIIMDHMILEKKNFKNWNHMIASLNKAYAETIILKKN